MPLPSHKSKKRGPQRKARLAIDASRLALAALERIRTIFLRTDRLERMGVSVTLKELAARAAVLGATLPPSYVASMRLVSSIGEPEMLLSSTEMARAHDEIGTTLRLANA